MARTLSESVRAAGAVPPWSPSSPGRPASASTPPLSRPSPGARPCGSAASPISPRSAPAAAMGRPPFRRASRWPRKPGSTCSPPAGWAASIAGRERRGSGDEGRRPTSRPIFWLSRARPVAVVGSGAKALLDLPATVEALESLGVPVYGFGTRHFPAFYAASSGITPAPRLRRRRESGGRGGAPARVGAAVRRSGLQPAAGRGGPAVRGPGALGRRGARGGGGGGGRRIGRDAPRPRSPAPSVGRANGRVQQGARGEQRGARAPSRGGSRRPSGVRPEGEAGVPGSVAGDGHQIASRPNRRAGEPAGGLGYAAGWPSVDENSRMARGNQSTNTVADR